MQFKKTWSVLLLSLVLTACASTQKQEVAQPTNQDGRNLALNEEPPAAKTEESRQNAMQTNPLQDPENLLSRRTVFYDYDSANIRDEDKPVVEAHARYLINNKNIKIMLQGHTDERGSREYNLALGQRRADSVKKLMTVIGVPDNQVETVSYGEERPVVADHNEEAYAQNRRTEIVYPNE